MIPSRPDHFFSGIAFTCAVVGVVGFFMLQIGRFLTPPKLFITNPTDGLMVRQPVVAFAGYLKESVRLTINGEVVYVEPETHEFNETVPLLIGENTFIFQAQDRLGRVREVVRRIYRF